MTKNTQVAGEDFLPEKARQPEASQAVLATDQVKVTQDEAITAKVSRYSGQERREDLAREIERLYQTVVSELNDHPKDTAFALKTLSEAQDIVLEDTRQYNEALYRVTLVKTMLIRKRNLRRWSYTWGLFIFAYALVWFIIFVAGYFIFDDPLINILANIRAGQVDFRITWLSALAGGIGGAMGVLYNLYWHVAIKQDFDRHYVKSYLLQPIRGFLLGAVIYFIWMLVFPWLTLNFFFLILLGWIAGFRQESALLLALWLPKKFSSVLLNWLKRRRRKRRPLLQSEG